MHFKTFKQTVNLKNLLKTLKPLEEESANMNHIVQNMHVILNPGFCDTDDTRMPLSPIKTHFYEYQRQEYEKTNFSRRMSVLFTGNTIKRIWVKVFPEEERLIIK